MSVEHGEAENGPAGSEPAAYQGWSRQRQWRWLAVAVGALLVLAAVTWLWPASPAGKPIPLTDSSTDGTFRPSDEQFRTLTVEPVKTAEFADVELTDGSIALDGDRTTPVYSPFSGQVLRVIAAPGQHVARGASLALVAASEFVQGKSDLLAATAQVKLARQNATRKQALFEAEGASEQDLQQAQSDLATAEATLQAARNRLRILGSSDAQIDALAAGGSADGTAVLTAPIDGVIVDRQIGPGQYLQAGNGTPAFSIADLHSVWLVANVREADAWRVRTGQLVEATVAALPGRVLRARVSYVGSQVDPNTHRVAVRAVLDNADGQLRPGMFADCRLQTGPAAQAPAVPDSAVVYEGSSAHVWVVSRDSQGPLIAIRPVRVGSSQQGKVQVVDGLKAGESVVTRGSLFIDRATSGG